MEKFLASLEEKSAGHKIVIVIGISVFLLFLIAVSILITSPKKPSVSETNNTSSPQELTLNSFPAVAPVDESSTYSGNRFQVFFPPAVYSSHGQSIGGEDSIMLRHGQEDGSALLGHTIEFQINNRQSQETIEKIFTGFSFTKEIINLPGTKAVKFSGQMRISGDNLLQETAIVFTKNGYVYKIQLMYYSPSKNQGVEDAFSKMMTTIKLF